MIMRAIIEQLVDQYTAKVRIPIYHKAKDATGATPTNSLPIAVIAKEAGVFPALAVGDIVLVGFEDDRKDKPVILGFLYKEATEESEVSLDINSLNVKNTAVLPINTTIGNITAQKLEDINFIISQFDFSESATGIKQLKQRVDRHDTSFAELYDKTHTYLIGNIVIYNSQLYKCNTTISTAEEWNPEHWTQINISTELINNVAELRQLIEDIIKGGRVQIGERSVKISKSNWTKIGTDREEYINKVIVYNADKSIPDYASVICSYNTEYGTDTEEKKYDFHSFAEMDAARELWIDSDVYLQGHKIISGTNNVELTFIANAGNPETLDLSARLLIFIDDTSEKASFSHLKISRDEPTDNDIAWINPDTNKLKYTKDTAKNWVDLIKGVPTYIQEDAPTDDSATWVQPSTNTLQYKANASATWSQLGNNIDIYYLTVSGATGWEQAAPEGDYFYPQYFKKFITPIPLSKHPKASIEIYPLIQPLSKNTATSASAWVASKRQCFIDKVVKDESTSSEYFVAFVYCENVFTDDAKDAISFQLFDFGKDDGV